MRVYISGPMTGIPGENREAFDAAALTLSSLAAVRGVVNPARLDHPPGATRADYMRRDIAELVTCDAVYLLPGWQRSQGARVEVEVAHELGLKFYLAGDDVHRPQGWIKRLEEYKKFDAVGGVKAL